MSAKQLSDSDDDWPRGTLHDHPARGANSVVHVPGQAAAHGRVKRSSWFGAGGAANVAVDRMTNRISGVLDIRDGDACRLGDPAIVSGAPPDALLPLWMGHSNLRPVPQETN